MSTATDRLAIIKQNYDDASDNEATDLAHAKSPVEVASIRANVANASVAYYSAVASMLSQSGAGIETAYEDATHAIKTISEARVKAAAIAVLLGDLSDATNKATILLNKAKSL